MALHCVNNIPIKNYFSDDIWSNIYEYDATYRDYFTKNVICLIPSAYMQYKMNKRFLNMCQDEEMYTSYFIEHVLPLIPISYIHVEQTNGQNKICLGDMIRNERLWELYKHENILEMYTRCVKINFIVGSYLYFLARKQETLTLTSTSTSMSKKHKTCSPTIHKLLPTKSELIASFQYHGVFDSCRIHLYILDITRGVYIKT